jgi:ATP-binding cassette subfamily F protein uup
LILDEPTNDLDLPTLSVLENFLSEFGGCLLIVSHDRYFMDKLVDHLLVFEGDGVVSDFPGNYSEYRIKVDQKNVKAPAPKAVEIIQPVSTNNTKKVGFKEKKEFDTLEKEISTLNKEKEQLTSKISDPALPFDQIQAVSARIGEITALIDEKELRWLELSEMMNG